MMKPKTDHPGVYIAPPLFYILIFLLSLLIGKYYQIPVPFFEHGAALLPGIVFSFMSLLLVLPAFIKFYKTKNTLITIRPATSLQTSGIYSITRNPMYLGLLLLYFGIAFYKGNWWTFIFSPLVILVVTHFVIKKEEKYLGRTFGEDYLKYKKRVRRWI